MKKLDTKTINVMTMGFVIGGIFTLVYSVAVMLFPDFMTTGVTNSVFPLTIFTAVMVMFASALFSPLFSTRKDQARGIRLPLAIAAGCMGSMVVLMPCVALSIVFGL